ncbi:MAG: MBL fold metallo-hydrolase [Zetaproteobacteria bacterium]|nr:MAG: MBL fold metallo-hydrolase [Zetaproteobacteria bacterium]
MREFALQFIGTGDSESLRFYNTNALITRNGKHLLVDCGWTAKRALHERGLRICDIDGVFVTHVHGDHVFGLERFGFESRYVYRGHRIKLYLHESVLGPLWDECLRGCMGYSSDGENAIEDFFDVRIVETTFSWEGIDFEIFPTTHTPGKPSFGVRAPRRFTFTSDTNAIPDLPEIAKEDPYVFHDLYLSGPSHPAHATPEELMDAYPETLLRRIWAVHYGDDIERRLDKLERFAGWVPQGMVFAL